MLKNTNEYKKSTRLIIRPALPARLIRATTATRHRRCFMSALELQVNGIKRRVDIEGDTSLLSVLREDLELTGAKYGCGEGQCGSCTVLVDGQSTRSCITQASLVAGKQITTIEGLE